MQYEFMVPAYHEVITEIPLEAVSFQGAILLILLVAIVLFKLKLSAPDKNRKQEESSAEDVVFPRSNGVAE